MYTTKMYTTEKLGLALVDAALSEWERCIRDIEPNKPDDRDHIQRYFDDVHDGKGATWSWFLHPSGGRYVERAPDGSYQEWCGLFVAYCAQRLIGRHLERGRSVPVTIEPGIAYYVLPSTHRIASAAKWKQAQVPPPQRPAPHAAQPGDIFTVGRGSTGSHIGIVTDHPNNDGDFLTVEGNAHGVLGDFSFGEGVIRRSRHIKDVVQLIRLGPEHYIEV